MSEFSAEQFFKIASEFKLGKLTTESFHPETKNLSHNVIHDLSTAIKNLKQVDMLALEIMKNKVKEIYALHELVNQVRQNHGKIFLCGCGATGRLSLAVETFARMLNFNDVIGFMAGGDYALIKSVESFEDRMSYGSRQLMELGFGDKDLLLAITEGGETSFVIGAALEAAKVSKINPYFIYCNPDQELLTIERSHSVLTHSKISKLNLTVGPMALSGSTRMQATTVQMLAAGIAITNNALTWEAFSNKYQTMLEQLKSLDYSFLSNYIEIEASIYQKQEYVTYQTDEQLGISILTDTTERSPTFSLAAFEQNDSQTMGLCYLSLIGAKNSEDAWNKLLQRSPRALDWGTLNGAVDIGQLLKYDISEQTIERRSKLGKQHIFKILKNQDNLEFSLQNQADTIKLRDYDFLTQQLALKMFLNTLSTLIMGRLGRYKGNMMTWVRPSNYKLIDRASRYVDALLKEDKIQLKYETIVEAVIDLSKTIKIDEPIVLVAYEYLKKRN